MIGLSMASAGGLNTLQHWPRFTARSLGMKPVKCFKLPPKAAAEAKRSRLPREDYEQIVLATWLTKNNILFFHCPNQGQRNLMYGAKLKRMGVKAGVPDLFICEARKDYHGLFLELKRVSGGAVSPAQQFWIDNLRNQGYRAEICDGAEKAKEVINDYFKS